MNNTKSGNSSIALVILTVVAILLVVGIATIKAIGNTNTQQASGTQQTETNPTSTNNPSVYPSTPVVSITTMAAVTGTSNADLDKDMQTINGKVDAVNKASGDVDTSFNNQSLDSEQTIK